MVAEITDANFEKLVTESAVPFFLVFTSPFCATCKKLSPVLETLSESYPHIGFGRIDISTNLVVPSQYDVLSIPSLLVFRKGKTAKRGGEVCLSLWRNPSSRPSPPQEGSSGMTG